MKATELRIGSWLLDNGIMRKANASDIMQQCKCDILEREYLKSIPLSEEILLKCGFEMEVEESYWKTYKFNDITIELDFRTGQKLIDVYFCGSIVSTTEYLHQLQNLYFVLTGEELEINLKD